MADDSYILKDLLFFHRIWLLMFQIYMMAERKQFSSNSVHRFNGFPYKMQVFRKMQFVSHCYTVVSRKPILTGVRDGFRSP